jgi:hypothetical protein
MALDHIPLNYCRMARLDLGRHLILPLDRLEVSPILHYYGES